MRKQGFTLVELMLVVAILGILGALVVPVYNDHTSQAKSAAVKSNLSAMRAQIELYKLQHKGARPGYVFGAPAGTDVLREQLVGTTTADGASSSNNIPTAPYLYGPYLKSIPENPFNELNTIAYVAEATAFAAAADGTSSGWLYKKETAEMRLNWGEADSKGTFFYAY